MYRERLSTFSRFSYVHDNIALVAVISVGAQLSLLRLGSVISSKVRFYYLFKALNVYSLDFLVALGLSLQPIIS